MIVTFCAICVSAFFPLVLTVTLLALENRRWLYYFSCKKKNRSKNKTIMRRDYIDLSGVPIFPNMKDLR